MATIFSDFRPAEYHAGKSSYVAFYVLNPETGTLVRKRIKVNRVGGGRNRDRYARSLCCEINRKLYEGWNPFMENDAYFSGTSMQKGIREFLETKGKNVRPDTFRSYHSYLKWFNDYLYRSGKMQMPVKTFTDRDAEKAMKELGTRTDIGPATYNSYLEFFRNLFNYFINRNWVKENPFNRVAKRREEQKRRDLIPPHVRQQIADYFIRTRQIPYLYIMQLCYRCLIRPKEILMLKIKDIDFVENIINLPAEVAKNHNSDLSLWLSVDPMSDKYPSTSPYAYCANNPVKLVDPDGREIWLIGTEEERNSAYNEMQNGTNLSIGMDGDGHIYSTGETKNGEGLSRADKKLLRAINDNRVNVYIDICSQPSDVQNDAGGAYMGTEYYSGTKTASSNNHVNLDELWITEMQGKEQHGRGIIHEATEGYAAGLIAIKKETSIKPASFHFVERMYKYSEIGIDDNGKMVERTTKGVDPIKVYDYPTDAKYYKKAHRWAVRVSL